MNLTFILERFTGKALDKFKYGKQQRKTLKVTVSKIAMNNLRASSVTIFVAICFP